MIISIHAPTRGATLVADAVNQAVSISIHAPTRGATLRLSSISHIRIISIHAPTRGATNIRYIRYKAHQFQSTLPQGERPRSVPDWKYILYFNPRSHKGSDNLMQHFGIDAQISIHAPTRGATSGFSRGANCDIDFNPRSHKGSDLFFLIAQCRAFNFNPRSHKGSDNAVHHTPHA